MHILLLVAGVVIVYVIYRTFLSPPSSASVTSPICSECAFAFMSNGLIFFRKRGGELQQVHSPYAQEAMDRQERSRSRHSWKEGTSFNIAAGGGHRSFEGTSQPLVATAAAYEPDGNLLYFLRDAHMGGLFRQEAASGRELRVVLKQSLHFTDLAISPDGALLAAASQQNGGTVNIAMMNSDGSNYREITGGDTIDSSPAWIPGAPRQMLYQSAGLARSEQGHILAIGNTSIQKLNLDTGDVTPILDTPAFDHLKPRVSPSGDLLFIRRPYETAHYSADGMLVDTLLFPFRLLRALFHYLNFFSLMYSRKPLTSANGPATQADLKNILLQGKRVDAEKTLRNARPVQGVPSLVPDSWQLVRRNPSGNEQVLATNVSSYDIAPNGTILYSNGGGIFVLNPDGSSQLAIADQLVGDVVATTVC